MKNTKQQKLKVLQLCAVDVTIEAFLLPLIDCLTAEGYDVHIVCSYGPRMERLRKQGYKIKNIEISRRIRPLSHFMSLIMIYPVVGASVSVNREIIQHGVNGYQAETTIEWIRALSILKKNKELR